MKQNELPKAYEPHEKEKKWISFWEEKKFFVADSSSKKPPYCIVIPPPNVTGVLHMGHALVNTLQDILIRWKRMSGFEALWVPGTDHAGISTQTVVERHLMAKEGKRRTDYTRDEFLKHVWQWKEDHENKILGQLKRLGASCDFSRLRFTMDEGCNVAVRTMFKRLFDQGLIYQGNYLVNWDPVTQTALADDEVEYEERETSLWHFKFPLQGQSGHCTIATTRPETMLGDVAVAVSPKDNRYKHLVGKNIVHPITGKLIPIIADNFVDPEFGTGMVKITPAHDPADYQMAFRHNLELINVLTPDGKINENGGAYQGLSKQEAREKIVQAMQNQGLLETIQRHTHRVGVSYRSKAIIEPYLSKQWFVKMDKFAERLKKIVNDGEVKIIPSSWENTYFHWIDNLRDWCISRQLWWGHRIPVWHNKENPDQIICYDGVGVPPEVAKDPRHWEQDPDVLDTWFSAGLWPFSTLGWPEKTADLAKFYPNHVLITGHDILFFWVARMMFMGDYALDKAPFPETFLHGLIYGKSYFRRNEDGGITYIMGDEKKQYDMGVAPPQGVHSKWEKLSKTKGNVIDPLEMIEVYGTDALRMTLCSIANQTPQIDLDRRRFEEFKNFANKVWNGSRFVLMHLEDLSSEELAKGLGPLALEDKWILSALNETIAETTKALEGYNFDKAATTAYEFFWNKFCAYYVEIVKPVLYGKQGTVADKINKQKVLTIVLCSAIRLMHPITPFITEEIFHYLKEQFPNLSVKQSDPYTQETVEALQAAACTVASYPKALEKKAEETEEAFALIDKMLYSIRNIRGEMKIPPQTASDLFIVGASETIRKNIHILTALVKIDKCETLDKMPDLKGFFATGVVGDITLIIPLPEELAKAEKGRLEKEKERLIKTIENLNKLFANEEFCQKASPEIIEKQKNALKQAENELISINKKLV